MYTFVSVSWFLLCQTDIVIPHIMITCSKILPLRQVWNNVWSMLIGHHLLFVRYIIREARSDAMDHRDHSHILIQSREFRLRSTWITINVSDPVYAALVMTITYRWTMRAFVLRQSWPQRSLDETWWGWILSIPYPPCYPTPPLTYPIPSFLCPCVSWYKSDCGDED